MLKRESMLLQIGTEMMNAAGQETVAMLCGEI